jgi:glucan phosphoethanolaminetransferase (alkaline phosphatase superfamily)
LIGLIFAQARYRNAKALLCVHSTAVRAFNFRAEKSKFIAKKTFVQCRTRKPSNWLSITFKLMAYRAKTKHSIQEQESEHFKLKKLSSCRIKAPS